MGSKRKIDIIDVLKYLDLEPKKIYQILSELQSSNDLKNEKRQEATANQEPKKKPGNQARKRRRSDRS
ncbi:hypothetical protein FE784_09125 [Paenibacillus hemerocallicola]|jgi:hypothetical protein|uniref:Uncharacterized protein n=1 Tax=Paenibacillus hemerocallicola TaxID=1172614 RepID=A0A5C4TDW9_9BACL|nr:hypothetical protein [Paenibacillus hemerocallicola]TNJ66717.1 hypothetical protein FE784_09125 [Paenibacillus hemerocallicola]